MAYYTSSTTGDFPSRMGPVGICLRLRRLAEQMSQDARRVYAELGLDIEPGWHAIFLLLQEESAGLGVAQIARALGISQPSASSTIRQMLERGYLVESDHPDDGRRKIVRLSARAVEVLPRFETVWASFHESMQEVLDSTGVDVLETVAHLEAELGRRSMDERVMERLAESVRG